MPSTADIVIPIYNEQATVEELIERLRRSCPEAGLLFVDNGSTDRTLEILARTSDIRLIRHTANLGYGRSILDGFTASQADRLVVIDADLEYWPEDVPRLLAGLESSDAVFGSRLLESAQGVMSLPRTRRYGNRLVTAMFNVLFDQSLSDLYTGIRAVRRSAVPLEHLRLPGFEFVLELAARFAQTGARITEVPARYTPRQSGRSKMRHVHEFSKFTYHLGRLRLSPLRSEQAKSAT